MRTGTVLDRILAQTQADLDARKREMPQQLLLDRIEKQASPVDVERSLQREHVAVIAEIKRASPSKGRFPVDVDPAEVVGDYITGGAAAISCLTDTPFFQGSLADLDSVVEHVRSSEPKIGVLRKDFIIDSYQIDEARAYGASCILLIVAALDDGLLRNLLDYASGLGLASLVEVHDETELDRALGAGASLIGINNRDLKTLQVDLAVTERVAALAPAAARLVGESGIASVADVERMAAAGVDAILVGESLIVHPDRVAALKALAHVPRQPHVRA